MRITGGLYRGKQITAPGNLPVRPTTDFAKTGLFNILTSRYDIPSLKVLDLYAGTGSITYEFISRSCNDVQCVDESSACIQFIRDSLKKMNAVQVKVIQADAIEYLLKSQEQFDIIFADPPFKDDPSDQLLKIIFGENKLTAKGMFILEHETGKKTDDKANFIQSRKYGNITFSFFRET